MKPDWIGFVQSTLGLISGVAFAIPFFREGRIKLLLESFKSVQGTDKDAARAFEKAQRHYEDKLTHWSKVDHICGVLGAFTLGLSFVVSGVSALIVGK
jgi:hypothetical protein